MLRILPVSIHPHHPPLARTQQPVVGGSTRLYPFPSLTQTSHPPQSHQSSSHHVILVASLQSSHSLPHTLHPPPHPPLTRNTWQRRATRLGPETPESRTAPKLQNKAVCPHVISRADPDFDSTVTTAGAGLFLSLTPTSRGQTPTLFHKQGPVLARPLARSG
jgi:hypothetical protein